MSNLYVKVYGDMKKTQATMRGKNTIEVHLHYNKNNYDEKIRITMLKFPAGRVIISAWVRDKQGMVREEVLLDMKGGE